MWPRTVPIAAAALALAGCAAVAPKGAATYNADGSATVTIAPQRVAECKKGGGCGLFSRAELAAFAERAATYGAKTCQRGSAL